MTDWLDLELAEALRPAAAPPELWDRVRMAGRRPRTAPVRPRLPDARWPIAAILTLAVAAATLWLVARGEGRPPDLPQLAAAQLAGPAALDLRSGDAAGISRWVRAQAGLDVSLPQRPGVRLLGARLLRRAGAPVAVVVYRVEGGDAVLLVARLGASPSSPHGAPAWAERGQTYALAFADPGRQDAACLLCHATL